MKYIARICTLFLVLSYSTVFCFDRTIFLWDLHDVVLKKDWRKLTRTAWHYLWHPGLRQTINKPLLRGIVDLIKKSANGIETSAEEYIWLAEHHNNHNFCQMVRDLQNAQSLNPGMVEIIQALSAQGCIHHVGSNIGYSCFQELINPVTYPQFKLLFSYFDLPSSQVVCFDSKHIVKKPQKDFFTTYLTKNSIDLTTTRVIFIDDKWDNIAAALKAGLTAIQFKNPKQLKKSLRRIGITI
jgi:FMN phosphatase YigB (HAD superfamily)